MAWLRQIVAALLALVFIVGAGESVRAEVAMIDGSATTMAMAEDEGSSDCGSCSGGDAIPAECAAVSCAGCWAGPALLPVRAVSVQTPVTLSANAAGRLSSGLTVSPHPTPPKAPVLS